MYLVNSFLFICIFSTVKCFSILGHTLLKELDKRDSSSIDTEWIEQPLDHFNQTDNKKWKMRYFQRLDMWKTGGPIYLFIGGEFQIRDVFIQSGTTFELAKETNGALFLSEHRFYGESKPFKDFTPENLRYLSSRQGLADVALLLESVKRRPEFAESKVVVVGGSYSGNLAAWFKLLYPNLVDAAIASSAPVKAQTDFYEYLETAGNDFKKYGLPECYEKIEQMFKEFEKKFETEDGIKQLREEFNICPENDLTKLENKQFFFFSITMYISSVAQVGDVNDIENSCRKLKNNLKNFLVSEENIVSWNKKNDCYDCDFDNYMQLQKNKNGWFMAWIYQTCTEFGYYQTTTSDNQPFTKNIPVNIFFKMCSSLFGKEFDENRVKEGVKKTNEMYGGIHPNVSKVVFVNGELDPWHTLSVLEDISPEAPAKVIPFSSHCRDLFPREDAPKELKEAINYIKNLIKKWIGVASSSCNLKK